MMYDFGIFGGDKRQIYIADMLQLAGYKVLRYGLSWEEGNVEVEKASSFFELLQRSKILLGPIPLSKDMVQVCHKGQEEDMTVQKVEMALKNGRTLIAGCIPEELNGNGYNLYDYMKDKPLAIYNSIATAEGAIVRAIEKGEGNLCNSKCLVIGYGVCGKTLATRLAGLKADVFICARNSVARTEAETEGYTSISFRELESFLEEFDYIFNTAPALVLGKDEIKRLKEDVVIIDIASAPGGVDYQYAKERGIYAKICPGLPGIYAPRASAEALTRVILRVKESQGN